MSHDDLIKMSLKYGALTKHVCPVQCMYPERYPHSGQLSSDYGTRLLHWPEGKTIYSNGKGLK
jgi:hypothetical protein